MPVDIMKVNTIVQSPYMLTVCPRVCMKHTLGYQLLVYPLLLVYQRLLLLVLVHTFNLHPMNLVVHGS
jgi:hypothetical protein